MTATATTDMVVTFRGKDYSVPEGMTLDDYVDSLRAVLPGAANAQLIDDGTKDGVARHTLKEIKGTHG